MPFGAFFVSVQAARAAIEFVIYLHYPAFCAAGAKTKTGYGATINNGDRGIHSGGNVEWRRIIYIIHHGIFH
jgi:hypothetical protein